MISDIFCVCFDVMYSGEYNVFDVTLSVYPHRAGCKKVSLTTVGIEPSTFGGYLWYFGTKSSIFDTYHIPMCFMIMIQLFSLPGVDIHSK
jgi:hypothetical protein